MTDLKLMINMMPLKVFRTWPKVTFIYNKKWPVNKNHDGGHAQNDGEGNSNDVGNAKINNKSNNLFNNDN